MTNKEKNKILILAEKEDGKTAYLTYELLRAGQDLANKAGGVLCIAVLGNKVGDISKEMARFSDEVYALDHPLLVDFQVDIYVHALEMLCEKLKPDTVLMAHSLDNMDLAPRLACKIKAQLITDAIRLDIDLKQGELYCDKPVFGDNAVATFIIEKRPRIVTLRSKVIEAIEKGEKNGSVIPFALIIKRSLASTESIKMVPGETVSLDKADAIVAGGRGIKQIEGLKQLEGLAEILKKYFGKVELGASRPLVDAGWLPSSRQLGLTGEKVSPELYIAVGISGASQHLSGVIGSKKIVAINKDEDASIFESSDYGVVGECEAVVPALIQKLREMS